MGALGTNFEQLVDCRDHFYCEGLPYLPIVLDYDESDVIMTLLAKSGAHPV